jgi:hypothetical protein
VSWQGAGRYPPSLNPIGAAKPGFGLRTAPLLPRHLKASEGGDPKPETYFPKIRFVTCLVMVLRTFLFPSAFTAALRTVGLLISFMAIAFFTVSASL